jgi:heat shock protein HslJ
MFSSTGFSRLAAVALASAIAAFATVSAYADSEFPFGFEMTLDTAPQPGSKRMPTLEIGDNGEATLDLWCRGGKGQFSVAGNTVIFVPGQMQDRASCAPGQSEADDDVLAALTEAATWKRQGDLVTFVGTKSLRFRINTN